MKASVLAIACEVQEEGPLMTAVHEVPDVVRQEIPMSPTRAQGATDLAYLGPSPAGSVEHVVHKCIPPITALTRSYRYSRSDTSSHPNHERSHPFR